jgi:hypothetical protein
MQASVLVFKIAPFDPAFAAVIAVVTGDLRTDDGANRQTADDASGNRAAIAGERRFWGDRNGQSHGGDGGKCNEFHQGIIPSVSEDN